MNCLKKPFLAKKKPFLAEKPKSINITQDYYTGSFELCFLTTYHLILYIRRKEEKITMMHFEALFPVPRERRTEAKAESYSKDRIFTFRGEQAWHPPDNATPFFRVSILKLRSRAFC